MLRRRVRKMGWLAGAGAAALAGVMAFTPAAVHAQEAAADASGDPNTGNVSLLLGGDLTTHYYFRGIFQENQGVIFQPYGEVGWSLYEGEGALNSLGFALGTWHSFHDGPTKDASVGTGSDTDAWYEADVYAKLSAGLFESWAASVTYTLYTSPNDSFNTIADVNLTLAYDDSAMWGESGFALAPYASVIFEVDDQADAGNSAFGTTGGSEGTYLELGVRPTFTLVESETMPVTLAIPVKVGLGLEDYYEIDTNGDGALDDDDTFGYASAGVFVSMPLAFIPEDLGAWTATAGATFMFLGDTNEFINAGQDDFEVIGTFGLSMAY